MFSSTVSSRTLSLQRLRPTERRVTVSGERMHMPRLVRPNRSLTIKDLEIGIGS
jgi:hypothetical protein